MIEKPKKGQEFSNYSILGRVLLTPEIYDILARTKPGAGGEIQLTDAMAEYARSYGGMAAGGVPQSALRRHDGCGVHRQALRHGQQAQGR